MWADNETDKDFLNFQPVARTIAEIIRQANGVPLSIGVSGGWGVGKSSLLSLVQQELSSCDQDKYLHVSFNAWLYQGYDDARAAFLDTIAQTILRYAESKKTLIDEAKELARRVDCVRVVSFVAKTAAGAIWGVPNLSALGDLISVFRKPKIEDSVGALATEVVEKGTKAATEAEHLLKDRPPSSPPREIEAWRNHFRELLERLGVVLVVFVDDLDRCLPATSISTLEAMRQFLFLANTAFVIAADNDMIRGAVRVHFQGMEVKEDLVTSYFDKLIQVPIRVPPLGTQDVRAYLLQLYIENSSLPQETKETLRKAICGRLGESWRGERVDGQFVRSQLQQCPAELELRLDTADRLAHPMATSSKISGNPRLIKRFLNTISIRMSMASQQGVLIDEIVLAKLHLLERCAPELYADLVQAVTADDHGRAVFIGDLEDQAKAEEELSKGFSEKWKEVGLRDFIKEWVFLPPLLKDQDLRPAIYVSREHLPMSFPLDSLSKAALDVLDMLMIVKDSVNADARQRIQTLSTRERGQVMDQLLAKARQIQEWGKEGLLVACLALSATDDEQSRKLKVFLINSIPGKGLKPAVPPMLSKFKFRDDVFRAWTDNPDVPSTVKKAIELERKGK